MYMAGTRMGDGVNYKFELKQFHDNLKLVQMLIWKKQKLLSLVNKKQIEFLYVLVLTAA